MKAFYFGSMVFICIALSPTAFIFAQDQGTVAKPAEHANDQPSNQKESNQEQSTKSETKNAGGLFIEPFLTYEMADVAIDYPAPFSSSTESVDGLGLGARLGIHVYDIIFLCADGRYSFPQYESSALSGSADAKAYNLGATAGIQTPFFGVRVWGTYIFSGMLDPESINNVDIKFSDFKGTVWGLVCMLPRLV